jgi:hypothetical protein
VQPIARVVQHFIHATAEHCVDTVGEALADVISRRGFGAGQRFVVLTNIGVFERRERSSGVVQRGCRHAPRSNRRTDQIDRLRGLRQPFTEQKPIQRQQREPLWAARRCRYHAHIRRRESAFPHASQRTRTGENL